MRGKAPRRAKSKNRVVKQEQTPRDLSHTHGVLMVITALILTASSFVPVCHAWRELDFLSWVHRYQALACLLAQGGGSLWVVQYNSNNQSSSSSTHRDRKHSERGRWLQNADPKISCKYCRLVTPKGKSEAVCGQLVNKNRLTMNS